MSTVYTVDNVSVIRGNRHLVKDVSLECESGTVIALIGPNGAGKSTLMQVLAGDIAPDRGNVTLLDRPLASYKPGELARIRAVLPQQTVLQFAYKTQEVVAMGRVPLPPDSPAAERKAVNSALSATETLHLRDRTYTRISGGEQGRVSLSRVLAQKTPVILLDEPTAALDIRHQHQIMELAGKLAESGATVIAIIHDLNLAFSYATRIGVMHQGELVAFDTPWGIANTDLLTEVFAFPLQVMRHPFIPHPLVVPLGCKMPPDINNPEAEPEPHPYIVTLNEQR